MSTTPTLLRVKRRKNDDPLDVLVLSAKKRKTESASSEEEGNIKILKLAATIDVKDDGLKLTETVTNILSKKNYPNFEELKLKYKKSLSSKQVDKEVKETVKENRVESRFRLVAQKRALKIEDMEEWPNDAVEPDSKSQKSEAGSQEEKELFHLYDVVSEDVKNDLKETKSEPKEVEKISCNGMEMIREYVDAKNSEDEYGYVYDVYYTDALDGETADFDDSLLDSLVSIQPFNSAKDFRYDEYRDDPNEFQYEDDDDSNDEFNERNDYPDEDDEDDERYYGGFDDEDDYQMGVGMRGMGLCDSDDSDGLSSDEEDQLLYTKSFDDDVATSGKAFARFKQQMIKEFYQDEDEEDDE